MEESGLVACCRGGERRTYRRESADRPGPLGDRRDSGDVICQEGGAYPRNGQVALRRPDQDGIGEEEGGRDDCWPYHQDRG